MGDVEGGNPSNTSKTMSKGSKLKGTDDKKSQVPNKSYQRGTQNNTVAGKTKGKMRKDYQNRLVMANDQGQYFDLTPDPLTLEDSHLKTSGHGGTNSNNASYIGKSGAYEDSTHSISESGVGGSIISKTNSMGTHSNHSGSMNSSYNSVSGQGTGNHNVLRELAQRKVMVTNSTDASDKIQTFFHGDNTPVSSLLHGTSPAVITNKREAWSEKLLLQNINIRLEETPTFTLISIPSRVAWNTTKPSTNIYASMNNVFVNDSGSTVSSSPVGDMMENQGINDNTTVTPMPSVNQKITKTIGRKEREGQKVMQKNTMYEEMLKKKDKDRFIAASTETPAFSYREKGSQTIVHGKKDQSVEARTYLISDAFANTVVDNASRVRKIVNNLGLAGNNNNVVYTSGSAANVSTHTSATASSIDKTGINLTTASQASTQIESIRNSRSSAKGAYANIPVLTNAAMEAQVLGARDAVSQLFANPRLKPILLRAEAAIAQNILSAQQLLFLSPAYFHAYPDYLNTIRGNNNATGHNKGSKSVDGAQKPHSVSLEPDAALSAIHGKSTQNGPILTHLWSFQCDNTINRPISCIGNNSIVTNILAVGYGNMSNHPVETNPQGYLDGTVPAYTAGGMICLWSISNPFYPALILHTKRAVTSLAFSPRNACVLAVGFDDGELQLMDVTNPDFIGNHNFVKDAGDYNLANQPEKTLAEIVGLTRVRLSASELRTQESHEDVICSLTWLPYSRDMSLLSASWDGTVRLWKIRHTLSSRIVIQLTSERKDSPKENSKTTVKANKYGLNPDAPSADVCLTEAILALDVPNNDVTTYIVGTRNGAAYRCSLSFDDHPLTVYPIHKSSVYRIACSPYLPAQFLTCSSDGTIAITHSKQATPLLDNLCRLNDYLIDIAWCPGNSTAFAFLTHSNYLYFWDIYVSVVEPVFALRLANNKTPTTLKFLKDSPVVLVGFTDGTIQTIHIANVPLSFGPLKKLEPTDVYSNLEVEKDIAVSEVAEELFKQQCERLHYAILTHCDFDCDKTVE